MSSSFAPGSRILARDCEWVVRRVDPVRTGGHALSVVGLSEIVRDKEAIFLTDLEQGMDPVNPEDVSLVADDSAQYRRSRLFLESLLRQTPPTDDGLCIGHKGAMDVLPFQLEPALQALEQPRQRILIADAVGLGKTIECGVMLSELIRRGKAKRILVLAVKSMLSQFQKELWARFSIPLVRLDSVGIQRLRNRIPANHNPFYHFDKAIISIDTLKQQSAYRTHLENCRWDVIVIDEAHNVALRGSSSLRAKLANLLSTQSDTLLLLSATPHDGRAESFASLMKMLSPTSIANEKDYGPEDIDGLFIRRFKKDVKSQIQAAFPEREIKVSRATATQREEEIFDALTDLKFVRLDQQRRSGSMLFKTTLEKTLFSSPWACAQSVKNRIRNLARDHGESHPDIAQLENLQKLLDGFHKDDFSKYSRLLDLVRNDWGWKPRDPGDRIVIFTESIPTLKFLEKHLPGDLGLRQGHLGSLNGTTMGDQEIMQVVEDFGRENADLRVLVCTEIASEGINLHHYCHRMIHFDVPWSLIRFQQRNGRIDRYGQQHKPLITYLLTDSGNPKVRGDARNLEILIEKDEKVVSNIGDPSEFTGLHDAEQEELQTARAMEDGVTGEDFDNQLEAEAAAPDPLALLWGEEPPPTGDNAMDRTSDLPTLYPDDYEFLKETLGFLSEDMHRGLQYSCDDLDQTIEFSSEASEFKSRLKTLPDEGIPDNKQFLLSTKRKAVMDEIVRCRKEEKAWPQVQLLWELHPVLEWANDKLTSTFRRNEAPFIRLQAGLSSTESLFLVYGLIPNRRGQTVIQRWFGLHFEGSGYRGELTLGEVIEKTGLAGGAIANPGGTIDTSHCQQLLPLVVRKAGDILSQARRDWKDIYDPKLNDEVEKLDRLQAEHNRQLEFRFGESRQLSKKEQEQRRIEKIFDEYLTWIQDVMTTEDQPYIRVVAVFGGC
jgi:ERCC4-related helicase